MKKVIITGPTGAVGISLIYELISRGISVTAVCRPNSKRLDSVPKSALVEVVECSVDRLQELSESLSHDYDAFFHFAWDGTYGDTRQNMELQAQNILYTLDAVRLSKVLNCSVFVGAGSQSEFGHIEGVLHPDTACNPDNGYGIAKLAAGRMSRLLCRQLAIRHEWCRIVSLYGPYDGAHTMVMSSIYKFLRGEYASFTKGEQLWDYIYSKDSARAFRLVAEKGKDGAIYCFGSGKSRLLKEYICAIRDAIDPDLKLGIGEMDYYPNQVMHLEADISNLVEDTGFIPEYSFEEGIKETIEWAKEQVENG